MSTKAETLCMEAMEALDGDQPEEALAFLDKALKLAPQDADALTLRAEALIQLERADEAAEALELAVHHHPKSPEVLLAAAAFAIEVDGDDEERVEQALLRLEHAQALARKAEDPNLAGEIARLRGAGFSTLGELRESAVALEEARELLGDEDLELLVELAVAWFELLRFDEAKKLLEDVLARDPEDAYALHNLGLVHERLGDQKAAEKAFLGARELEPEDFPAPFQLSTEEFNAVIETALAGIPAKVREQLANVPIIVEDLPGLDDLQGEPPLSPLALGLFRGSSLRERSVSDTGAMPSTIHLYQRNLERYATSREELVEEIETTLLHEVGHFVGWDEDDVKEHGLE